MLAGDFLFGTMIFNFVPILEYAAVNYGITLVAAKKTSAPATAAGKDGEGQEGDIVVALHDQRGEMLRRFDLSGLANLDHTFRWLFPICYAICVSVMFGLIGIYGSGATTCDFYATN